MQLQIIRFIQSFATPWLDQVMIVITWFGQEMIIAAILAFVYWSLDKRLGRLAAISAFTGTVLNCGLKGVFMVPRPIGTPGVRTLYESTAGGYSFPSGHTQTAASAYFALVRPNQNYGYLTAGLLCVLVGLSRLYLGVHWPLDVVVGLSLGFFVAIGYTYLYDSIGSLAFLFGIVGAVLAVFFLLPFPVSDDFYKAFGGFVGVALGCLFEERFVDFTVKRGFFRGAIRWVLGLAMVYFLRLGFSMVMPAGHLFYMAEYGAATFFLMGLYPLIFKHIRL